MKILFLKFYSGYVKEYNHCRVHLHHNSFFLWLKVRNLIPYLYMICVPYFQNMENYPLSMMITKISSTWISMWYWPIDTTVYNGFVQNLRLVYSFYMFVWAKYICIFYLLFVLEKKDISLHGDYAKRSLLDMENYTSISSES
jgi:hypothetical protein